MMSWKPFVTGCAAVADAAARDPAKPEFDPVLARL
jgi:hypothetical protein